MKLSFDQTVNLIIIVALIVILIAIIATTRNSTQECIAASERMGHRADFCGFP